MFETYTTTQLIEAGMAHKTRATGTRRLLNWYAVLDHQEPVLVQCGMLLHPNNETQPVYALVTPGEAFAGAVWASDDMDW